MNMLDDIFTVYARGFEAQRDAEMSLAEYLDLCRGNHMAYATATERLLAAIAWFRRSSSKRRLGRSVRASK